MKDDRSVFRLVARSIVHMAASVVLAFVLLALVYVVVDFMKNFAPLYFLYRIVYSIANAAGGVIFYLAWFALFMLSFIVLQWLHFRRFAKVSETVRLIADGQLGLNHHIQMKGGDPFGALAGHVNRLSDRLQHALEEERRSEQTKNELITNVSHDLRTPLTSVIGYLGLIDQDRYRDEIELRHYVQIAYEKSQRLNVLIDDLFEYTRMRHDSVALKLAPINLAELLGQLLVQYDVLLREADMEGKLHHGPGAVMIRADADKLVRVFENLLANAISYGKSGKRIDIFLRVQDNRQAIVEVVNYGEPIPAIDLPHIFDRFYRADKSRTEWSGGSGLGLAIAKSIVEKHGGAIGVSSAGDRTSFQVNLPIL